MIVIVNIVAIQLLFGFLGPSRRNRDIDLLTLVLERKLSYSTVSKKARYIPSHIKTASTIVTTGATRHFSYLVGSVFRFIFHVVCGLF